MSFLSPCVFVEIFSCQIAMMEEARMKFNLFHVQRRYTCCICIHIWTGNLLSIGVGIFVYGYKWKGGCMNLKGDT